jgi:hypothetical protein
MAGSRRRQQRAPVSGIQHRVIDDMPEKHRIRQTPARSVWRRLQEKDAFAGGCNKRQPGIELDACEFVRRHEYASCVSVVKFPLRWISNASGRTRTENRLDDDRLQAG